MAQRASLSTKNIALLSTGDEIQQGDILNSNAQDIAQMLTNSGMHVGTHMVVGDYTAEIETAIQFLLETHDALIMTGGLGPTSDDLTRFALGRAVNQELLFDEGAWQNILDRFKKIGLGLPPENNRQQALFPQGATIIPNPNGTAAGCYIQYHEKLIFMLPGPPHECLPMITQCALPLLTANKFQLIQYHKKWLLFGMSEGHIAETLDQMARPYGCTTGYRLCYPYIEFKLFSTEAKNFETLLPQIEQKIAANMIGDGQKTASEQLKSALTSYQIPIHLHDLATGGLLAATLNSPKHAKYLIFSFTASEATASENIEAMIVDIMGLEEYWQQSETKETGLKITLRYQGQTKTINASIPFRGERVRLYATEYICRAIYDFLEQYK